MPAKTDFDYLRDMLRYAEDGHALVEERTREDLETDMAFRYGVQYCILIVGEAATQVSDEMRARLPGVPWREIVGMRNWLVHGYSRIRAETIWETATRDLPRLVDELLRMIPPEQM